MPRRTDPHLIGVQRTPRGYRAFVRVAGHPLQSKRFPSTGDEHADLQAMQRWRERTRALLERPPDAAPLPRPEATFRSDAILYLESVKALVTYKERVKHIFEWVTLFGAQETATITAAQIRAQRDRWLTVGPRVRQRGKTRVIEHKPLAASSVNHRLRALENLFTVLYPGQPNPVRQVPEVDEPRTVPRALSAATIRAIFRHLPPGKTKARLAVLKATGLPAKTLMRLRRQDVDLRRRLMMVPGRQKGQQTPAVVLPLLPDAVAAFQQLQRVNGWGAFSTSSMHSLFVRACEAAGVTATPYQLRHTFATDFLRATQDLRATQRALTHSTPHLTERYARAAVDPALRAAFLKVAKGRRKRGRK